MKVPMKRRSWHDFRDSGLLWWVNGLLHMFGWAIVLEFEKRLSGPDALMDVYPVNLTARGFSREDNDEGYERVTQHMLGSRDRLLEAFKPGECSTFPMSPSRPTVVSRCGDPFVPRQPDEEGEIVDDAGNVR